MIDKIKVRLVRKEKEELVENECLYWSRLDGPAGEPVRIDGCCLFYTCPICGKGIILHDEFGSKCDNYPHCDFLLQFKFDEVYQWDTAVINNDFRKKVREILESGRNLSELDDDLARQWMSAKSDDEATLDLGEQNPARICVRMVPKESAERIERLCSKIIANAYKILSKHPLEDADDVGENEGLKRIVSMAEAIVEETRKEKELA